MDLIIHSLKSIAVAIIEPMHLVMLVVFGIQQGEGQCCSSCGISRR